MHLSEACLDPVDDSSSVFAFQSDHRGGDNFLGFAKRCSISKRRNSFNCADIFQQDWNAAARQNDGIFEIRGLEHATKATDRILLLRVLDIPTAKIGIVVGNSFYDFMSG